MASDTASAASPAAASGSVLDQLAAINELIRSWEANHTRSGWDPSEMLAATARIVELETESYLKADPDPFDERHPTRVNPMCTLGQLFRVICKKDAFMDKLVLDYTRDNYWQRAGGGARDSCELNTQAARLLFDIMPGLETSVVFQDAEPLVRRLFAWASAPAEPLRSYATALLASAMEIQDIAANFRDSNAQLLPDVMRRLKELQAEYLGAPRRETTNSITSTDSVERPFACVSSSSLQPSSTVTAPAASKSVSNCVDVCMTDHCLHSSSTTSAGVFNGVAENSNSSWAELAPQLIATFQVYPPTLVTRQILLLCYLTPLGEYQEWLCHVIEQGMLDMIVRYVDSRQNNHARLTFEALRYLSSLLCHTRFTLNFLSSGGVPLLLSVPRPGVAATGVSMCLYYLAYNEDAMERICQLPDPLVARLVRYTLWLLECSHESGRCHATMCCGLSFQFRAVLGHFDRQDGIRRLLNVVSTQRILTSGGGVDSLDDEDDTSADDQFPARQIMHHVCTAIKCYLETHLVLKAYHMRRSSNIAVAGITSGCRANTVNPLYVAVSQETVHDSLQMFAGMPTCLSRWKPINAFLRLGGLRTLLQIIDISRASLYGGFSGRSDTLCAALDALNVCCVLPASQLQLCERLQFPGRRAVVGIALILSLAVGTDARVQKAALRVIISCVARVLHLPSSGCSQSSTSPPLPASQQQQQTSSSGVSGVELANVSVTGGLAVGRRWLDDVLPTMWDAVRRNNGIMVLMSLVQTKTPITDADAIRALACRALVGLARSDSAQQVMSKLPLFTSGQLQAAVREPILQEKRAEHVQLRRDALTLLERVSGRDRRLLSSADSDITLSSIHRAFVVAQTRIHYNERQLLQLMHAHLLSKGLTHTASVMQAEAALSCNASTSVLATPQHQQQTTRCLSPVSSTPRAALLSSRLSGKNCTSATAATPTATTPSSAAVLMASSNNMRNCPASNLSPAINASGANNNASSTPGVVSSSLPTNAVSLDGIVTEYLMNQHALCRHPTVTCPQFDLLQPHRCPEPVSRRLASANITARASARRVFPPYGGCAGGRHDTRLLYSRYCPVRTLRDLSDDTASGGGGGGVLFTSATFSSIVGARTLLVGSHDGAVRVFNVDTGELIDTYTALHSSAISHLQLSADGRLLLTCSRRRRPLSALWTLSGEVGSSPAAQSVVNRRHFADDEFVQFGRVSSQLVLGTERQPSGSTAAASEGAGSLTFAANLYDIVTGQRVRQLTPRAGNGYAANRAVFSPDDQLVFNDGVLFDARSPSAELHKFDKFQNTINGEFHPWRPELLANSQVWDLRTFHLLHTVAPLDQCRVHFAHHEPVMFGVRLAGAGGDSSGGVSGGVSGGIFGSGGASGAGPAGLASLVDDDLQQPSSETNAFRVLHAADYSAIATVDVRRHVGALCVALDDLQLAVVESQPDSADLELLEQACVRLYDVGRVRGADNDDDDNDDGEDQDDDEDDDDDEASPDDDDEDSDDASDRSDNLARDIADALFGYRRRRRRRRGGQRRRRRRHASTDGDGSGSNGDGSGDSSSSSSNDDSDATFSLSASDYGDNGRINTRNNNNNNNDHNSAERSDNSWVTEDDE